MRVRSAISSAEIGPLERQPTALRSFAAGFRGAKRGLPRLDHHVELPVLVPCQRTEYLVPELLRLASDHPSDLTQIGNRGMENTADCPITVVCTRSHELARSRNCYVRSNRFGARACSYLIDNGSALCLEIVDQRFHVLPLDERARPRDGRDALPDFLGRHGSAIRAGKFQAQPLFAYRVAIADPDQEFCQPRSADCPRSGSSWTPYRHHRSDP